MDGILIIDKPVGPTSHDVVARVRRILKTKRVGHTGTLDPFATGVMVILVGQATRLAQFLDKDEKEYKALLRFGAETDTGDVTGARTAECGLPEEELSAVLAETKWEQVLQKFRGEIDQVPPMYSAKKVEGKKLYELARKGVEIKRRSVRVNISALEIENEDHIRTRDHTLDLRVVCSAGTYIRTLAEEIGRAVGVGAHLAELRRTRAGRFDISKAATLEALEVASDPPTSLIPMSEAVTHLPGVVLDDDRILKTRNGLSTRFPDAQLANGAMVRMLDSRADLIAIGIYNAEEKTVQPKVVLG